MALRLRSGVIVVDKREERSGIPETLSKLGISVRYEFLEVGDYLLPGDILVERKTVADFISSLIDGRLFDQASNLLMASRNPTILIEGDIARGLERFRNKAAFWGAVVSLGYDLGLVLLYTPSSDETASLLASISKHSQSKEEYRVKPKRRRKGLEELQLSIVASLPGVGPIRARRLLERLGSIRAVFSANASQLSRFGGIPYETSLQIFKLLNMKFGIRREGMQERINGFSETGDEDI